MTVLRHNCEKKLVSYLEDLRRRKSSAWVIWVHLGQMENVNPLQILERAAHVADQLTIYGEHTIYLLGEEDAFITSEQIYPAHGKRIIKEITPLLAGPQKLSDATPLCDFYSTIEQFSELSKTLAEKRRSRPAAPRADVTPIVLNTALFRHAVAQRKARKRLCILIVEDQRFSCKLVVDIVNRQFEYMVAENGMDALYLYEAYAPDIVFLDIGLPVVTGLTVLQQITKADNDSFIVMLTASQTEEDVQLALKSGAMGYIIKPFSKQKIQCISPYTGSISTRRINNMPDIFDIQQLRENMGEECTIEHELLCAFIESCEEVFQDLHILLTQALSDATPDLWKNYLHHIKGAAMNVCAPALMQSADEAHNSSEISNEKLHQVEDAFLHVKEEIMQLLRSQHYWPG